MVQSCNSMMVCPLKIRLPQFPLPTHKVVSRGYPPKEFERNLVKGDALLLEVPISDLPPITTHMNEDGMEYGGSDPKTDFQSMWLWSQLTLKQESRSCMIIDHCVSVEMIIIGLSRFRNKSVGDHFLTRCEIAVIGLHDH